MTRYELLERIGAGRVAEIFRGKAIAAGGFEKPVAIKRILPHLSQDRRFVEALIAEAKILSALRHRNIVQIFDVGLGDDGQHFLVMEFVDGVDLGALQSGLEVRRQRLPIDLVLHIGAEVCEALEHAYSTPAPDGRPMRLVHRDVTPSNVLVSRAGEVKLTDFGLAKRPEDGTHTGGLKGRYGYVSPEQAAGEPVDGRSDAFAVGVIMWELAAGRRLFSNLPDFDALRAVREKPIPRVRDLVAELPDELDAILAEALEKDPRKRLPSAGELGKRLRGLRYSLETSTGDPAAALARMVATNQSQGNELVTPASTRTQTARGKPGAKRAKPNTGGFETAEPTILRIRTADGFAQQDTDGSGIINARRVIDRFEEEETRLAHVPRGRAISEDVTVEAERASRVRRDSGEVTTTAPPLHLPRESAEITAMSPALDEAERSRAPDRRPKPAGAGAGAGARLDRLPSAAAKGPSAPPRGAGASLPPPAPPPVPAREPASERRAPEPAAAPAAAP
ncbi:MAG TPA: serine/threonine-protein kinase, partial [Kofleriaceae bacterium]|nr:serine/threonine-protein kinase [Kofleriaceae bacterium]